MSDWKITVICAYAVERCKWSNSAVFAARHSGRSPDPSLNQPLIFISTNLHKPLMPGTVTQSISARISFGILNILDSPALRTSATKGQYGAWHFRSSGSVGNTRTLSFGGLKGLLHGRLGKRPHTSLTTPLDLVGSQRKPRR